MCRLFFVWNQSTLVSANQINTFLAQTRDGPHRNPIDMDYRANRDGYGFAGFRPETGRWSVYKSPDIYLSNVNYPRVIAKFSTYPFVVGHIRNISTNNTLPIYGYENTHPFYYKNHVFLHNGLIYGFYPKHNQLIDAISPDLRREIRGNTDTELFFYLLLSRIRESNQMNVEVLHRAFVSTLEFIKTHFKLIRLNIIYANKTHALFARYVYDKPPKPPSSRSGTSAKKKEAHLLYWNMPTYSNIQSRIDAGFEKTQAKWIITSEPIQTTQTLIPSNTLGILEIESGKLTVSRLC